MSVNSDVKKFDNYKEEIEFCKGLVFCLGNKVLLIGSNQFKQDVLGNTKEIKLSSKEKYDVCICEQDYIKELSKYTKKIKNSIFVVSNDEQSELTLQYNYPSLNNDNVQDESENNCQHNCDKCNQENSFEEELTNFIEEYAEVIEANPEHIRDILYEFYWEVYGTSHLQGKMDAFNLLSENIQTEVNELNSNYYNEGNGYMN